MHLIPERLRALRTRPRIEVIHVYRLESTPPSSLAVLRHWRGGKYRYEVYESHHRAGRPTIHESYQVVMARVLERVRRPEPRLLSHARLAEIFDVPVDLLGPEPKLITKEGRS